MLNPFPVRIRAASVGPRWSIIHTQKPDYVAGHSYFVALYSRQIADLIEWKGDLGALLWTAIVHDTHDELVVGDVVGPVKSNIIDPARFSQFVSQKVHEMMPGLPPGSRDPEIKLIVKAADQLDALFFTLGEQALGNRVIAARIPSAYDKLREAWFRLPGCEGEGFTNKNEKGFVVNGGNSVPVKLMTLWLDVVVPAVNEHRDPAMYDIERR